MCAKRAEPKRRSQSNRTCAAAETMLRLGYDTRVVAPPRLEHVCVVPPMEQVVIYDILIACFISITLTKAAHYLRVQCGTHSCSCVNFWGSKYTLSLKRGHSSPGVVRNTTVKVVFWLTIHYHLRVTSPPPLVLLVVVA